MIIQFQISTLITTYGLSYEMNSALKQLIAIFKNQVAIETKMVSNQEREGVIDIEIKGTFGKNFEHSKEEFDLYLNAILAL